MCGIVEIRIRRLKTTAQYQSPGDPRNNAGWRGLEPGFSFEPAFRISITAPDGKTLNLDKEMFALLAEQYGLEAADFEREFIAGGERFRITARRPKYPISVQRIPDRRGFKFTADNVAMLLKAQAKP
ncbi:hypothetical protein [Mesorhizobium jarvisii]|uniref:hypothetical protein n=1 Tax=Mesorhizobium jarvisii TaxID=1777867 RepID=UPI001F0A90AB|nr:hypothetical protein [Mesorhizobium jarvisii]MCH4561295.1 hypothetical protein [Mesorhizobium jarvisii]